MFRGLGIRVASKGSIRVPIRVPLKGFRVWGFRA